VNGNGEYSDVQESYAYLRGEFVTGIDFGSAYPGGFYPDISVGPFLPGFAAYSQLPAVRALPFPAGTGDLDPSAPWTGEISKPAPAVVIDPESAATTTVYEEAPGGIYETARAPTDWDAVYEQYVILNAPEVPVFHGSIDWGEVVGTIVGGIWDPTGAGAAAQGFFQPRQAVPSMQAVPQMGGPAPGALTMAAAAGCPPTGPKYGKICLATGEITPLRRRRRRRLLTSSDIKDLSALKSIVGGAALQGAVVQAVRR